MERTLSREELAAETDLPFEVLDWMAGIGILKSGAAANGRFAFEPAGARDLKGFAEPVATWRARRPDAAP